MKPLTSDSPSSKRQTNAGTETPDCPGSASRNRIRGYLMVTPSHRDRRLAPWVAADRETGEALLQHALRHRSGRTAGVGVPAGNHDAFSLLEQYGFHQTDPSWCMRRGEPVGVSLPECVFGLFNGAMG